MSSANEQATVPMASSSSPSSSPPPPPPKDVNPFEEPPSSVAIPAEQMELPPPTPQSPPPPVPTHGGEMMPPKSPPPPIPHSHVSEAILKEVKAESLPPSATAIPVDTPTGSTLSSSPLIARRKVLDETRLFEQRRAHHFGEKFDGDNLYWKCFVELIRRSQKNNHRAITYATEKLKASQAYASALYSIRDHVDGQQMGTNETDCEKERKKKTHLKKHQHQQHEVENPASASPASSSALDSLVVMEEQTAMRIRDMVDEMKVSVIEKRLKAMVRSLDDRFADMVGQGTACLRLMHAAESNSARAYSRYQDVVSESLKREDAGGARAANTTREPSTSDVWLADMNYRVAVTQQGRVWKGVGVKLGELFGKMKDVEVERRQAIQAGLLAMTQTQDALWRELPVLKDPVIQSLDRINTDRHLLDQEVRFEMRTGAARMRANRPEGAAEAATRTDGAAAGGQGGEEVPPALPDDFLKYLESPLESKLIARSTMLERRDRTIIGARWILVLGILTHDLYLLLFDVPKGCAAHKKQLRASPGEVFAELVPKGNVDTMAAEIGHGKGSGLDSSGLPIPPTVAIDLSACKASFKPDGKNDAAFEIVEYRPARGMKGVFKDFEENRYVLRGRSQESMVDWVCDIKEMGRAGVQVVEGGKK